MKTNIFLNSYQQAENKLTYNFLSILEFVNSKSVCEFLVSESLSDQPMRNIRTVYGGGESNPDGSFELRRSNGTIFTVFFENKTKRRHLSVEQLQLHLKWLKNDDQLLVMTPRKSDISAVRDINDTRIKFFTWGEVAQELKRLNDPIVKQFLEYGELTGEFEELGELDKSDIDIYCAAFRTRFRKKLTNILDHFRHELSLEKYGFRMQKYFLNNFGRYGVELRADTMQNTSFGQFWALSYYYDSNDHSIPFRKDEPEICAFFDIDPSKKELLRQDAKFITIAEELKQYGFESNLNEQVTTNEWRLLFYRKPISEFSTISVITLLQFSDEVFNTLLSANSQAHPYFAELMLTPLQTNLGIR